jgi:multidrug efflux pump subunit AcrB
MTTLVMVSILGAGLLAYFRLPVSDLPNVDFPTINVSASLPGADPETMASSVAMPLEKEFSTIAGIESMTSTSSLGATSITIQFDLARDIDAAAQDVQAAISQAQRDLPTEMPSPPSFPKVNPAEQPILMLAAYSESLPLSKVDEYAETLIGQRLSTVSGVAQVDVFGSQKFAVRVKVDPRELAARGIGFDDVENAIREANSNEATGELDAGAKSRTIKTTGRLKRAEDFHELIVSMTSSASFARISLGFPDSRSSRKILRPSASAAPSPKASINSLFLDPIAIQIAGWPSHRPAPGPASRVTLSFDLAKGTSLSDVVPVIERVAKAELGEQVSTQFQGTAQAFQSSLGNLGMLLLMAVLVIYIILGILYESFIHPLTILSGLPSAGFGALLTLALFGQELNVYGFVGLLMLIGIVKKNAIMMIDFALDAQRNDRKPPATAIFDACIVRFRPIMMTTLAAMMGTLPIALGLGAGGDVRRPLGLAVVGGLVISQIVTLYITPNIYLYLERLQQQLSRKSASSRMPKDAPAASPPQLASVE